MDNPALPDLTTRFANLSGLLGFPSFSFSTTRFASFCSLLQSRLVVNHLWGRDLLTSSPSETVWPSFSILRAKQPYKQPQSRCQVRSTFPHLQYRVGMFGLVWEAKRNPSFDVPALGCVFLRVPLFGWCQRKRRWCFLFS